MPYKVGINGFGRIGKQVFKILRERGIEVPLVNDPFIDTEYMHYLVKYDSTFGKNNHVVLNNGKMSYNGCPTNLTNFKDPSEIPWKDYSVNYVVEATGVFTTIEMCEKHLGVEKVVITAPSSDAPMFVIGVNHKEYKGEKIISNASCTTNCLAPLANVINKHFGIEEGLMTTVHSVTANQKIVDGISPKNRRSGRSGMQNIIPSSTGAAKAVGKILPELNNRLNGMAMRVPVSNVSVVDLTVRTKKSTTLDEIKRVFKEESNEIIGVTEEENVSSDFIGEKKSCIYDPNASMQMGDNFFKLIAWYDNEYGYSSRVCDLIHFVHEK